MFIKLVPSTNVSFMHKFEGICLTGASLLVIVFKFSHKIFWPDRFSTALLKKFRSLFLINEVTLFHQILYMFQLQLRSNRSLVYIAFLISSFIFIRPSKTGRIMGSPVAGVRAGGRRPVLCPEHISKTTLARVMKFHGWIDLIHGEQSAQES